jgi:butyryl-CoA dehydrogenase
MFSLMNHARVYTGIQAIASASTAYQCALQYARERVQGRDITCRDPLAPQVPIIEHPDVRNMLLRQKAFVEGALSMVLYCASLSDHAFGLGDEKTLRRNRLLLEVLTPCCKAHCSNASFEAITQAVQCFGGAGFCEEYPVAQLLRDNKVFSIYEGANGIQAMDLLGRKVPMEQGAAVKTLMKEIAKTIEAAGELDTLKEIAAKVQEAQNEVINTTMHLAGIGMSGEVHLDICNATMFLEMFSQLIFAWQWLVQAIVAQKALDAGTQEETFYRGKVETARFYVNNVLPHALTTAQVLRSNERTALDFKPEWF